MFILLYKQTIIIKEKVRMKSGIVKWFDSKKGFGFISGEDGKAVFCHYSAIIMEGYKKLENGQQVTYELGENEKGIIAVNIKKIS